MKNKSIRISAILILLGMIGTANATMFQTGTPGGSFDLGTGWVGQGDFFTLNIDWSVNAGFANQAFNLNNVGDMATLNFGTANFGSEFFIDDYLFLETDNLGITANVDLVLPEILGLSSIGLVGTVGGFTCDIVFDCFFGSDTTIADVSVVFDAVQIGFGDDGIIGLELSDVIFTDHNSISDITAKFTLLQAETVVPVPLPPALVLMVSGLFGIASIARRQIDEAGIT